MTRPAKATVASFGGLCWVALGLVQMAAEFAGLNHWLGVGWPLALVISAVTGWLPLIGTIMGFLGATKVWGWSWYVAAIFFGAPLLLLCLFAAVGLFGSLVMRLERFKKKQPDTDPGRLAKAIDTIIYDYGEFLENDPVAMTIRDEKLLPYEKEIILTALCVTIAAGNCTPERRQALMLSASTLAWFQKGIGNDLYILGADMRKLNNISDPKDCLKLILGNPAGKERYDQLMPVVNADSDRIWKRIEAADRLYEEAQGGKA